MFRADPDAALADATAQIVERCGPAIVMGAPLGLGKPNRLINALYRRVAADPQLSLTILTALSLARPNVPRGLAERFAAPFVARHFGEDYPDLDYVADLRRGSAPPNVTVHEFYLQSGAWLGVPLAQQNYASINYTHVARDLAARGVNLIVQLVARRDGRLSLACNTDVTLDLIDALAAAGRPRPFVVASVHPELPFVAHHALVDEDFADLVIDEPAPAARLFALPRGEVALAEYALGIHAARLVSDDGTLQIGIGALADALVYALVMRHADNATFRRAVAALGPAPNDERVGHGDDAPFVHGLYGASEMVMDGFMHLRRAGILTRRVYDDLALQRLINAGLLRERADAATLERLLEAGIVATPLDQPSVDWLVTSGLLDVGAQVHGGKLTLDDGRVIASDLTHADARHALGAAIEGRAFAGGVYLRGAFFLGSAPFYDWLRGLDGDDFAGFDMTRVSDINALYGGREALDIAQRKRARFFNTTMMMTLLGAAVSDALDDGRVVSGVGGQYNFVAMAHALPEARSVLMLRATRESAGRIESSIRWNYGHTTIPRHLRDVVVTEYGVAELRGQHDAEVITRLLAISDARFIDGLVGEAKRAGKLAKDFVVPEAWRANHPAGLTRALAPLVAAGRFPEYPFGSDFTAVEQQLAKALGDLKRRSTNRRGRLGLIAHALARGGARPDVHEALERMALATPRTLRERLDARLVAAALRKTLRAP